MSDPVPYSRTYSFTDYQAGNPSAPLPGIQVDNELEDVEKSLGEAIDAIKDVRRSDGALKNGIVTVDSLSPQVAAGVGAGALASAQAAAASADAASDSAVAAAASATAADGSATAASGYASNALTSRNAASGFADDSAAAASLSQTARDYASKWATEAEDVDVNDGVNPVGKSAYHWAQVALDAAAGSIADGAVTTAKIADGALSADSTGRAKMADGFVTSAKIADGTIARTDLATAVTDELDGKAGLTVANTFTKTQVWSKGADIASASALALGTDGNYFDVTGTTAITSINTVGAGAVVIKLHFDDILTLTHHATDLILPGGANITTAAGDEAEFVEYAAGDWRCVKYQRANLQAILHVRDEKAAGTAAGASVVGVQVRTLNTVVANTIPGASLSANIITLPAGTYDVQARAPAFTANAHQAWLRVSGGGAVLMDGSSEYAVAVGSGYGWSVISGRLTLTASTNIELVHYISNAQAANGLGTSPASGRPSIYAEAIFRKVNP